MNKLEKYGAIEAIYNELDEQLTQVSNSSDIERRMDLKKMIMMDKQKLEKTENIDLISTAICQQISDQYLNNPKAFPKSLIDLYYHVRTERAKYDGVEWSTVQAGLTWFE